METEQTWDTDRTFTVPNIVSFLRLLSVPVFGALIIVGADLPALILLILFGATDWLDGFLARRLRQRTELGAALDPIADRFFILVTVAALTIRGIVPWWFTAILLARDVLLLIVMIAVRSGRTPLRVNLVGKAGTLALLIALPAVFLGGSDSFALPWMSAFGWGVAIVGAALYWIAGVMYLPQLLRRRGTAA